MTEGKLNIYEMKASEIVSISHRYCSTFKNVNFVNYYYEFQSLIGTVQRYIMIINYEFYAKGFNLS